MGETSERRVEKRADALRQYKDQHGIDRTDTLTQKQRDEALHREVTGNTDVGKSLVDTPVVQKRRGRPPASIIPIEDTVPVEQTPQPSLSSLQPQPPLAYALRSRIDADNIPGVTVTPTTLGIGQDGTPEVNSLLAGEKPTGSIYNNAATHPRDRIKHGLSTFAENVTPEQMEYAADVREGILADGGQAGPEMHKRPVVTGGGSGANVMEIEPPPVRAAEQNEPPGLGKQALAALGALIPVFGPALMVPFANAQRKYLEKSAKDEQISQFFWKEFAEDPLAAKRLSRVPIVRDALQRKYGMSGDEIIDLDKSLSSVSPLGAREFMQLIGSGRFETEGDLETPYGTLKKVEDPLKDILQVGSRGYYRDPKTGTISLLPTEKQEMYSNAYEAYLAQGVDPANARLMALQVANAQQPYHALTVGSNRVMMLNKSTGKYETINFDDPENQKYDFKVVTNITKTPVGIMGAPKNQTPTMDNVKFFSFESMRDAHGNNVADLVRGYTKQQDIDSPGFFSGITNFISRLLGKEVEPPVDIQPEQPEQTPVNMAPQQTVQRQATPPAAAPRLSPITPPPMERPPVQPKLDEKENKKVRQLLSDTGVM